MINRAFEVQAGFNFFVLVLCSVLLCFVWTEAE
ncbi:hypothetical protein GQ607_006307 [Colletotrichum asianum]|uniref:Uncharacterized protein n=1 Tax=Colletotrichum asianum TaxID=702518 RepID=A0A8H3ZT11_9PEZI|nr:hypothetical protein GQ607_006307 [Colletotrichum asianum]